MDPIRVLLCNHHPIIRSGLRLLLEREPEIRVVGEAADSREAVALTGYRHPTVVLLDVKLPYTNGIMTAREISSNTHGTGVVFVSEHVDEEYVVEAFKAGARGYVLADSVQTDLIRAIRVVAKGGRFLSPGITSQLLDGYARKHRSLSQPLSENEKRLFCLLAEGYDEQEIARNLNVAFENVRSDCEAVKSALSHFDIHELIRNCIGGMIR